MTKVTLANVPNLVDATTAQSTINANSAAIVAAVENTLSRDGTSPNTMGASLDMNSHSILNLPVPTTSNEPARIIDVQNAAFGTTPVLSFTNLSVSGTAAIVGNTTIGGTLTTTGQERSTMAAATIKGNATAAPALSTDFTLGSLTNRGVPDPINDKMLVHDNATGTLKYVTPGNVASTIVSGVSSLNGQTGALFEFTPPQGRLTLTSGLPVMASSVAAATSIYYTPFTGNLVPLYDGTNMFPAVFSEIANITTDATKNPAAVVNNSLYDLFVWNDAGTLRISRGPAWTNDTTRSAGTALVLTKGIYLNSIAITNGPGASRGTYVGTMRSNGTASVDYNLGAIAAAVTPAKLDLWNTYNRVSVTGFCGDTVVSWTYGVSGVWRAANANNNFRVFAVRGLQLDGVKVNYHAVSQPAVSTNTASGVGFNITNNFTGLNASSNLSPNVQAQFSTCYNIPPIGYNFWQAVEYNSTATPSVWNGQAFPLVQSGLGYEMFQ